MGSIRQARLNDLLKSTISEIILLTLKDPRIGFATVTGVKVARDLKSALVMVSHLGDEEEIVSSINALQHAAPFIQYETAKTLRLKYTPKLKFICDRNIEYAMKINKIIDEIHHDSEE